MTSLTKNHIDEITDFGDAFDLAEKFDPKVNLDGCEEIEEIKVLLQLALRKKEGKMENPNALVSLMDEQRKKTKRRCDELTVKLDKLAEIVRHMKPDIKMQLEKEQSTKDALETIENFKRVIADDYCPIVIVGESSSGKSSVLNLFFGKEENILPSHTLSCTATICEILYGETQKAQIVKSGAVEDIPFKVKDAYIFKKENRCEAYSHDAVRLFLDVQFLKTGITVVDTPGIGENGEMSNIVIDYIKKNPVYGFVFTIQSSAGGGVLKKFQNLLHTISSFQDEQGQKKFDPKSVVFVCSFWDKVPDENKESTKQHIFKTLESLPCMAGFNARKQVYFMNTKFAKQAYIQGLYTDDFTKLIGGLHNYFGIWHKRKLILTYQWMETFIVRALHPTKTLMNRQNIRPSFHSVKKNAMEKKLEDLGKKTSDVFAELERQKGEVQREILSMLKEVLVTAEAKEYITNWSPKDVPTPYGVDNFIIIEYALDEAIDDRIAQYLQSWESDEHKVLQRQQELIDHIDDTVGNICYELEILERIIQTAQTEEELTGKGSFDRKKSTQPHTLSMTKKEEMFVVKVGRKYGSNIIPKSALENLTQLVSFHNLSFRKGEHPKSGESMIKQFHNNKTDFMKQRALTVYDKLGEERVIVDIAEDQMKRISEYLEFTNGYLKQLIERNKILSSLDAGNFRRNSTEELVMSVKKTHEDLMTNFDALLGYAKEQGIKVPDFTKDDEEENALKQNRKSKIREDDQDKETLVNKVLHSSRLNKDLMPRSSISQNVTFLDYPDPDGKESFKIHLKIRESQKYFQEQHLRQLKKFDGIANLIGSYDKKHQLVLQGSCIPARNYFGQGRMQRNIFHEIIKDIAKGLSYLHIRKLVHIDVSLDSVLFCDDKPLLVNLSDQKQLVYAGKLSKNQPVGALFSLPKELLQGFPEDDDSMRHWLSVDNYNAKADMYGFGMMILEMLTHTKEIVEEIKMKPLKEWLNEDQLQYLTREIKRNEQGQTKFKTYTQLALKCLSDDPRSRILSKKFIDELEEV